MTKIQTTQSPSVAGKKGFSLISDEKFRQIHAALLQCRMLDEHLQAFPAYESWPGREAASAAVAACLRRDDTVVATKRSVLARYLHNGIVELGSRVSRAAAQLAAVNKTALGHKLEKNGAIAVVFAQVSESAAVRESFTFAAQQSLPVLYVVEGRTLSAETCNGMPLIRVDGSDTVALYRVAFESIARAREGGGPTIIECASWPSDPRPPDPLLKFEQYLAGKKLFRPHWKRSLERKYADAIAEAAKAAKPAP